MTNEEIKNDIVTNNTSAFKIEWENKKPNNTIELQPELEGRDICFGADPFIFKKDGNWNLFLQEDFREDPMAHEGIKGCTIRTSSTIEGLAEAPILSVNIPIQRLDLHQSWAPEIFGDYLYIAHSDGDNKTHRMYVYKTFGDLQGPWEEQGRVKNPTIDDSWAIDMTFVDIPINGQNESYAVWSGWDKADDEFPQNLYIARRISPTEIGERHLLAKPERDWATSVKPLLEGPQALILNNEFKGLLVSGNASWTEKYATGVLKFDGRDPLDSSSWIMGNEPLFPPDKGIGHGMIIEDDNKLFFVGHRKTSNNPGWSDRKVFYTELDRNRLENYLNEITRV